MYRNPGTLKYRVLRSQCSPNQNDGNEMTKRTAAYWEEYYRDPLKFGQIFRDYEELKNTKRTVEQGVQYRVVCELIDGAMSL